MGYLVYMIFLIILIASILIPVTVGLLTSAIIAIVAALSSSDGKKTVDVSSVSSPKVLERRRRYIERKAIEKSMTSREKYVAIVLGTASFMQLLVIPISCIIHAFCFYTGHAPKVYDEISGLMRRIPDLTVIRRMDLMIVMSLVSVLVGAAIWLYLAIKSKARTLVRCEALICFPLMPVILTLLLAVAMVARVR